MNKNVTLTFNPRIVTALFGSELVESASIVIAEQIKNSIDAKAKKVRVDFRNKDKIEIIDDGEGVKNVEKSWFQVGTKIKNKNLLMNGGKGIGRFCMFRLGKKINVESTTKDKKISFELNKSEFENGKNTFKFVEEINSSDKTGTKIIISELEDYLIDYKEIEINLRNLLLDDQKTEVKLYFPENYKREVFLSYEDVEKFSLLNIHGSINLKTGDNEYHSIITDLDKNITFSNDKFDKNIEQLIKKTVSDYALSSLGKITFSFSVFYGNPKFYRIVEARTSKFRFNDVKNKYLIYDSGVNIYRNNIKLFNFGKNDWLGLNASRINQPSKKVDNNLIAGKIILTSQSNEYLIEKTNREGLVKNEKFVGFKGLINEIVKQINADNNKCKQIFNNLSDDYIKNLIKQSKNNIVPIERNTSSKETKIISENSLKEDYSVTVSEPDDKSKEDKKTTNKRRIKSKKKIINKKISFDDSIILKHITEDNIIRNTDNEWLNQMFYIIKYFWNDKSYVSDHQKMIYLFAPSARSIFELSFNILVGNSEIANSLNIKGQISSDKIKNIVNRWGKNNNFLDYVSNSIPLTFESARAIANILDGSKWSTSFKKANPGAHTGMKHLTQVEVLDILEDASLFGLLTEYYVEMNKEG